ncbi:YggS family pyridoxal phosphate-dependent enzyme [Denitrobaculum tricleocarpae]|uniref:Pyridoxal phosphate homeostasis protein n=2 Tax=Denitrobaculum tricleocarpae TaxID=2591009 RepID=A0A545TRG3_9PROT|nr:YggS family pyridoxal phosphate-dependent enzyme [Denitrobaculum tricleocarpae]
MNPAMTNSIADTLTDVEQAISQAAQDSRRQPGDVKLVAVSKTYGVEQIQSALNAGHRVFGENRVQEAQAKFPGLKDTWSDIELHLIGPLQTNKAKDAVALFDVIQTLDRPKLARALAREMERSGRRPDCFIQVNTGEEEQKAGIAPADLAEFVALARDELALPVVGLMCIPPVDENPALHFAFLNELARRLGLTQLSMGMSADYEQAVRLGATVVRVGSAIFGKRKAPA